MVVLRVAEGCVVLIYGLRLEVKQIRFFPYFNLHVFCVF